MNEKAEKARSEWIQCVSKLRDHRRWRMRMGLVSAATLPASIICIVVGRVNDANVIANWVGWLLLILFIIALTLVLFFHGKFNNLQETYDVLQTRFRTVADESDFISSVLQTNKLEEDDLHEYTLTMYIIATVLFLIGVLFIVGGIRVALIPEFDAGAEAPRNLSPFLGALHLRWPVAVSIGFGVLAYSFFAAIVAFSIRTRLETFSEEIRETEYRLDLSDRELSKHEARAEKLFRINQYELSKYYSLNLKQNRIVFGLGFFCIVAGLAIIGATLWLVAKPSLNNTFNKDMIIAIVGGIGAILVNFVAAIFLQIHSKIAEALTKFHGRLVVSHELFLANVLASRAKDDEKRQQVLSEIAIEITKRPRLVD